MSFGNGRQCTRDCQDHHSRKENNSRGPANVKNCNDISSPITGFSQSILSVYLFIYLFIDVAHIFQGRHRNDIELPFSTFWFEYTTLYPMCTSYGDNPNSSLAFWYLIASNTYMSMWSLESVALLQKLYCNFRTHIIKRRYIELLAFTRNR